LPISSARPFIGRRFWIPDDNTVWARSLSKIDFRKVVANGMKDYNNRGYNIRISENALIQMVLKKKSSRENRTTRLWFEKI
jgi:hypothetical protein